MSGSIKTLLSVERANQEADQVTDQMVTLLEAPPPSPPHPHPVESTEGPLSQWSSLLIELPEENRKRLLAAEGLYSPGSDDACAAYIAMSDSAVLRHPYYNYPAVRDPGVNDALLADDPPPQWDDDGQDLYLNVCAEMDTCPVRMFHRGLLTTRIDLSYYGVDPASVRAMCLALSRNKYVLSLDLTDNWLTDDACYHLGQLFLENSTISELNLTGCRIGPSGLRNLIDPLPYNRTLRALTLNSNCLGDAGVELLASLIEQSDNILQLYLSNNGAAAAAANALTAALEFGNKLTHLDLSWNQLFAPAAAAGLITRLSESKNLVELNLSWNALAGPKIGLALKNLMTVPSLRHLDLSNNKLCRDAIDLMSKWIFKAKKLNTLDLSYNPLEPEDAVKLLSKLMLKRVKIQNLRLDNVWVDKEFVKLLSKVRQLPYRRDALVTYGGVISNYEVEAPDPRELILNRASFLAAKPKKNPVDVAVFFLTIHKESPTPMSSKDLVTAAATAGFTMDDDLADQFTRTFPGPKSAKGPGTVNLNAVVDYVHRMWPEARPPPTPPPTPPPEPPAPAPKGKGGKKGKKNVFFLTIHKESPAPMSSKDLVTAAATAGFTMDDDLADQFTRTFPGPKSAKGPGTVNLNAVVDYVHRMWPEARPPPTPPPTPPPEPPAPAPKGKGGKKGKKK